MIGVEPAYSGLKIEPCLPAEWDGLKVRRTFRNCIYNIEISRSESRSRTYEVYADGTKLSSSVVLVSSTPVEVKVLEK